MSSIKLTADSGGGTFEIKAPASSANTRSFTLPDVATGLGGILEFDSWYNTASRTGTGVIDSNLARNNFAGAASQIGTGMTESSGIFTFPSTGKYLVIFNGQFAINGSSNIVVFTQVTTNNSSYSNHARALDGNNGSGERSGSGSSFAFIDVTDTSQVKVRFNVTVIGGSDSLSGHPNYQTTTFTFIRIGDT
tara:strand:- start:1030 stop:1605 length:576 start_codon:yes stop_codon:yes gene_type:complete